MRRLSNLALFRLLFAASLLIPASYFSVSAWESRTRALLDAERQIVTTVRLLCEDMSKVLLADKIALTQVDHLVRGMSWHEISQSPLLHAQLREVQVHLPQVDSITLIAPDGEPAASSTWTSPPGLSVADRDYFTELRDHPDAAIYVSRSYIGRIRHRPYFNIAQRRTAAGGGFDGIIVLSIRPDSISDFYASFAGPEGLAIVLMRDDGAILARYPAEGATQLPPEYPLLIAARQAEIGTLTYHSSVYHESRLAGFAHVHDSDLLVAYARSRAGVLAPWRSDLRRYGMMIALGSIALAMMTWVAMRNLIQITAARARLEAANAAMAQEVVDRTRAEAELRELNSALEQRVAARTRSLAELAAQRARESAFLAAVFESTPYAKIVVDSDGTIIMANTVAETLFSYDHDALLGQPLELLVPSGLRDEHEALRRGYSDAPSARPMGSGRDLAGVRQDGAEVPIEILLSPLETPDGPAVIAGIVDISGRKRSEAALHQAIEDLSIANLGLSRANATIRHKSEEVEAFVYIVSHDLRTPLINLQGFSRELQFGCAALRRAVDAIGMPEETLRGLHTILDEDIDGTLHYIRSSATKFERLITALLELSRTGQFTLHSETLDIPAIVAATLESLGQPIGEACADIEVGALPDATGDATAVGQIFGNLIENAVKYAQPGRTPRVEIGGEVAEGMVRYWVRDNGVGIPESARARLFQVFQRFHPNMAEGEGIGLASVRRLVERHGGTVWADSAPGVGTSFHFTLPAKPQEPA